MERRIDETVRLLGVGLYDHEVRAVLEKKYDVSAKTCRRYMGRARERLVDYLKLSRDDHRAYSLNWYRSVVADENASNRDKIRAVQRIDALLGLAAPRQLQIAGEGGGPVKISGPNDYDDPELRQIARHLERRKAALAAVEGAADERGNGKR